MDVSGDFGSGFCLYQYNGITNEIKRNFAFKKALGLSFIKTALLKFEKKSIKYKWVKFFLF